MAQITASFRMSALRRGIVVKPSKTAPTATNVLYAASLELANLGFLVRPDELEGMSSASLEAMLKDARTIIGADRAMTPIYPGFPQQVEELSTLTLLVEQILHYMSAGALRPDYPTIAREGLPLEDMLRNARQVRVLSAAATARELIKSLATEPVALSEDDRALLKGAIELQHPDTETIQAVAKAAHNGENLQAFIKAVAEVTGANGGELLTTVAPFCDNADQLLRVTLTLASKPAAPQWEANYELAVGTLANRHHRAVRMGKLSRPVRRAVLDRLGAVTKDFKADSLVSRQELWRSVMKTAHPYDFKLTDAQRRAADIIHSNGEYRTLNSHVEGSMEAGNVVEAVELLAEHKPGELLRRSVALLRLVKDDAGAEALASALRAQASRATLSTLISAYNGILAANDDHARVTRVAGLTNTMVERAQTVKVDEAHLKLVTAAVKDAMAAVLKTKPSPAGSVGVESTLAVPLVRRDAATADRVMDRGAEVTPVGEGDVLRIFGHWNNNQDRDGYMDIGAVVLDDDFNQLGVSTWNSYSDSREWSTYSGDCLVYPGDSAAEFIDVKLAKLRKRFPKAKWVAMTVQSWSGWPMANVDFIAGSMLRSNGEKGEVFDARSVASAFKPTTQATQAVPYAVNLETGKMMWLDSSNGSTEQGVSATNDDTVGAIVYDELERPRLTMGELATLWAKAHNARTEAKAVDRDALLALLG